MHPFRLLITRKTAPALPATANEQGVQITERAFIATETDLSESREALLALWEQRATVAITSRNTVRALLTAWPGHPPPQWKIYCIEGATSQQIATHFGEHSIAGTAPDGFSLANLILERENPAQQESPGRPAPSREQTSAAGQSPQPEPDLPQEPATTAQHEASAHLQESMAAKSEPDRNIVLFCGDRRRDELPQILGANGWKVQELVVYRTLLSPVKIEEPFDGIAFFSPSAVESYFSLNRPDNATVCFAIGPTTASCLKKYTANPVITSSSASEQHLVSLVAEYADTLRGNDNQDNKAGNSGGHERDDQEQRREQRRPGK